MSAKQYDLNEKGEPQKKSGWFSWRHQSREEHDAARERYLAVHGRTARRQKAALRDRGPVLERSCGHRHGEFSPGRCEEVDDV